MLLAGCGIPTGVSAVAYAADGMSAGASGKTVNDHLISQIANMDCGLIRLLSGEWICRERGIDPDDNTIYAADGRTMDGPPRPWGTIAEPELQYEDGNRHDAREWAEGIKLAEARIGDDPTGKMLTADHDLDDGATAPARIGDMSEARDRQDRSRAVAGEPEETEDQQTAALEPARQSSQMVVQAQPSWMINFDSPAASESPGPDPTNASASPIKIAAPTGLSSAASSMAFAPTADRPVPNAVFAPRRPAPARTRESAITIAAAPPSALPRLRDRGVNSANAPPATLPHLRDRSWLLAVAPPAKLPRLRDDQRRFAAAPPTRLPRLRDRGLNVAALPPDTLPRLRDRE